MWHICCRLCGKSATFPGATMWMRLQVVTCRRKKSPQRPHGNWHLVQIIYLQHVNLRCKQDRHQGRAAGTSVPGLGWLLLPLCPARDISRKPWGDRIPRLELQDREEMPTERKRKASVKLFTYFNVAKNKNENFKLTPPFILNLINL